MAKATQRIYTINVRGAEGAIEGTDDMITSVVEALQSQYPKLKIEATRYMDEAIQKPILMVPTKLKSAKAA